MLLLLDSTGVTCGEGDFSDATFSGSISFTSSVTSFGEVGQSKGENEGGREREALWDKDSGVARVSVTPDFDSENEVRSLQHTLNVQQLGCNTMRYASHKKLCVETARAKFIHGVLH